MTALDGKNRVAPKKIILATDFSPQSEAALPYALTIARHYGSELFVAHVISPGFADHIAPGSTPRTSEEAQRLVDQNMERFLSAGREWGVSCQPLIGDGEIWDILHGMILQCSIDLIVVGTHGRRGLRKLAARLRSGGGLSNGAVSGAHRRPENLGDTVDGCSSGPHPLPAGVRP